MDCYRKTAVKIESPAERDHLDFAATPGVVAGGIQRLQPIDGVTVGPLLPQPAEKSSDLIVAGAAAEESLYIVSDLGKQAGDKLAVRR